MNDRRQRAVVAFVRATEALVDHPCRPERAAVWAAIGMVHLSYIPGVECGERWFRQALAVAETEGAR